MSKFTIFQKSNPDTPQAPTVEQLSERLDKATQVVDQFAPAVGDLDDRLKQHVQELEALKAEVSGICEKVEAAVNVALTSFEARLPKAAAVESARALASNGHEQIDLTKRAGEKPAVTQYTEAQFEAMSRPERFRAQSEVLAGRAQIVKA